MTIVMKTVMTIQISRNQTMVLTQIQAMGWMTQYVQLAVSPRCTMLCASLEKKGTSYLFFCYLLNIFREHTYINIDKCI